MQQHVRQLFAEHMCKMQALVAWLFAGVVPLSSHNGNKQLQATRGGSPLHQAEYGTM